jgi:hypothetical protein
MAAPPRLSAFWLLIGLTLACTPSPRERAPARDGGAPEAAAVTSGESPRLVYATWNTEGVYAVAMDTPDQRENLVPPFRATGAWVRSLAYSPDGAFVANVSQVVDDRWDLFVRARRGGSLQALSAGLPSVVEAHFAPNAHWLTFTTRNAATNSVELHLADLAVTPARVTSLGPIVDSKPIWSGDGRVLAFSSALDKLRVMRPSEHSRSVELTLPERFTEQAILSHSGRHVAWQAHGQALVATTDGRKKPEEMRCPAGLLTSFRWAGERDVQIECGGGSKHPSEAVCSWSQRTCRTLAPLSLGPRCGDMQILCGPNALYRVSLAHARWEAPAVLTHDLGAWNYRRPIAFDQRCEHLTYAHSRSELARLTLDRQGRILQTLRAPLDAELQRYGLGEKLWSAPDGSVGLAETSAGLSLVRWEFARTRLIEPPVNVERGVGFVDASHAVVHGRMRGRTEAELLLMLDLNEQRVSVAPLLAEDLSGGEANRDHAGFVFAPDGRSVMITAGARPRSHPAFELAGSGMTPLLIDLETQQFDVLMPKPSRSMGKLHRVQPLGTRALVISAAVEQGWDASTFVHDLRALHPVRLALPLPWRETQISNRATAAAFHEGDRLDLLQLAPNAAPHVRTLELSVETGAFSGDEQWYLARTAGADLYAVPVRAGDPVLLARGARLSAVAPSGTGIALTQGLEDGRSKLLYLNLRDPKPTFVDLWEGRGFYEVWFSDDGSQLAYTSDADDGRFALKMWRVGAPGAGHLRGTFVRGGFPANDGDTAVRHAYAFALRGLRGLLMVSGVRYYLDRADVWVVPWLGTETQSWRLPTESGVLSVQQSGDSDLLIANEANAKGYSGLRSYRIGAAGAAATLAEQNSSTSMIQHFELSPAGTHVAYDNVVVALDAANPASSTMRISEVPGLIGFSPDGRYVASLPNDDRLHVLDVTTGKSRVLSDPKHRVRKAFWLVPGGDLRLPQPPAWQRSHGW